MATDAFVSREEVDNWYQAAVNGVGRAVVT